jgi:ADP-ribosylglycohydrolase
LEKLFDKIYGALIGSAIGDAMGGPVEGLHYSEISKKYGKVETLLPYTEVTPSYHGPFATIPGAYTDDTRLSILFANAIIHSGGIPKKGDIAHALADYFFNSKTEMERGFIEEYYLKAMYGDTKEVFGGRPTNGGIMGIAPLGAIFPCDPDEAFSQIFQTLFISTGSARSASAFAAALIAGAMKPDAVWNNVMEEAFSAAGRYKYSVEASGWRNSELYPIVAVKTEQMARMAMKLGSGAKSVYSFNEELYKAVVQPFFADSSESLAIAVAMFCAAKGDFKLTVQGCVNFGRDNDSSAAVGGAIAGALCGASGIPSNWIETVENANPRMSASSLATLKETAEVLTGLTIRRYKKIRSSQKSRDTLFFSRKDDNKHLEKITNNGITALASALSGGDDPDQTDNRGKTALLRACDSDMYNEVSLLLMYGSDVNICDIEKNSPLHSSASNRNNQIYKLLLLYGADESEMNAEGKTAPELWESQGEKSN